MTTARILIRPCEDGRWRLLVDLLPGFASEGDADLAARYLADHLRARCGDVLDRLVEHASDDDPLAERIPRAAPTPAFRAPD